MIKSFNPESGGFCTLPAVRAMLPISEWPFFLVQPIGRLVASVTIFPRAVGVNSIHGSPFSTVEVSSIDLASVFTK